MGTGLAEQGAASARAGGWLVPDALIVVEEAAEAAFEPPDGLVERSAAATTTRNSCSCGLTREG